MTRIEIGEPFQAAGWFLPGGEAACRREIAAAFRVAADEAGLRFGPIAWRSLDPQEDEAPAPDRDAPRGVRLLLGEARVVGYKPQIPVYDGAFVESLDPKDLARLRAITRRAHAKRNPGKPPLTDAQCDIVINEVGPQAAGRVVRAAVDSGQVQ